MEIFHIIASHTLLFLSILGMGGSALKMIASIASKRPVDVTYQFIVGAVCFTLYYLNY